MSEINIEGLDKIKILHKLWENSKPATFFVKQKMYPPTWDEDKAKIEINKRKYIDYFEGRLIKMDLSGGTTDPHGYDRDYGKGSAEKIINTLRT